MYFARTLEDSRIHTERSEDNVVLTIEADAPIGSVLIDGRHTLSREMTHAEGLDLCRSLHLALGLGPVMSSGYH
jgi:hypothetical protein